MDAGRLREVLLLQTPRPPAIAVASLTRTGTTATAITIVPHGLTTDDFVDMDGADLAGYNGRVQVTVTAGDAFTYQVADGLASPAAGLAITVTYASDAQGGVTPAWRTIASLRGELLPMTTYERLQAEAMQAQRRVRFRVRIHPAVTADMRVVWLPGYPPGAAERTLPLAGPPTLEGDGRQWMVLDCLERAA